VNFDLLNSELRVTFTVARELASQNSKTDFKFAQISTSHFNENILGFELDSSLKGVYDRWEREDCSVGIIEYWVLRHILDNVKIFLELLVL